MAFHPFKHFRKHQKVYLAGLTILTMIIFVFSFGAADPFQRAMHWIGLTAHHGERVVELYGKTIHTDDLEKLRWQRQLASEFLVSGSVMEPGAHLGTPLEKAFFDIQTKFGPKKGQGRSADSDAEHPPTGLYGVAVFSVFAAGFASATASETVAGSPEATQFPGSRRTMPEQYRALDTLATILAFHAWAADPQRQPNDSYFGGSLRPE